MASSVYSTRFISAQDHPVYAVYTVPAGYRAIVRDVDAWYTAGDAGQHAYLQNLTTGAVLWSGHYSDNGDTIEWRGRQVVEPGEQLAAGTSGSLIATVSVSGYLLTLP